MIYLDYSATTPVDDRVLDTFCLTCKRYVGNANSIHSLGVSSRHLMEEATSQVARLLQVAPEEVIFTSSASESNNLAFWGTIFGYPRRSHLIVTTPLEHDSILGQIPFLESLGYTVRKLKLTSDGLVDLEDLALVLQEEPLLVSIGYVNSELGIVQPIDVIAKMVDAYPRTFLHVDGTQAVGKIPVELSLVDLFSFSAHKFFGLKGIACLIKKKKIRLEPMIHGGKSQTSFRSGTPALPLIVSLAKALRISCEDLSFQYAHVLKLNQMLREAFAKIPGIVINSNTQCLPYILNISVLGVKPETMIHALEERSIYLSTKTACAKDTQFSETLLALKKKREIAAHSLRISLSYRTTEEEIKTFLKVFQECYTALNFKKEEN